MDTAKAYTLAEAQQYFAKSLNGEVWDLLGKTDRTTEEDECMVYAAYASCYHWLHSGTVSHHQRGEWLIAHVYSVLGMAEPALRHAARCLELTQQLANSIEDFDLAYAYEGMARANALAANKAGALKYLQLAENAGSVIRNAEDRSIFFSDFNQGNWYGIK